MLICWNAERVHGQRKVGNPCLRQTSTPIQISVTVCRCDHTSLPMLSILFATLATDTVGVCTFHDGCKQGIDQQIFNRKSISRKITHPQF